MRQRQQQTRRNHRLGSVEGATSASTGGSAVNARSAAVPASVSMDESAEDVWNVEAATSASTDECAVRARSVEVAVSVSMVGGAVGARSV